MPNSNYTITAVYRTPTFAAIKTTAPDGKELIAMENQLVFTEDKKSAFVMLRDIDVFKAEFTDKTEYIDCNKAEALPYWQELFDRCLAVIHSWCKSDEEYHQVLADILNIPVSAANTAIIVSQKNMDNIKAYMSKVVDDNHSYEILLRAIGFQKDII